MTPVDSANSAHVLRSISCLDQMVRLAQERTPTDLNVRYVAGDAASVGETILSDESFDVVLANYLLSESPHPATASETQVEN